jgi:Protein of unknown function (DUF1565)
VRALAQTTWYVDQVNGNDSNPGSQARPFQSITRALTNNSLLNDDDTLVVLPGTYSNKPKAAGGTEESFPLKSAKRGVRISGQGTGSGRPVVSAVYFDGFNWASYAGWPFAETFYPAAAQGTPVCLEVGDAWTVENLRFINDNYRKQVQASSYNPLHGIRIENLGLASPISRVNIVDCDFDDNFNGIFVRDENTSLQNVSRRVTIQRCHFQGHGPVRDHQTSLDNGHAAVLIQCFSSMTVDVQTCTFQNNHDAVESGNSPTADRKKAIVNVTQCVVEDGENGIEFEDGVMTITDSTFRRNWATEQQIGGVGFNACTDPNPPYANVYGVIAVSAIGLRGANPGTVELTVRGCTFEQNQLAIKLGSNQMAVADLGTDLDSGRNSFTVDITSPWDSILTNSLAAVSYCALLSRVTNLTVQAVGNLWMYDPSGAPPNPDYNQGVSPNREFAGTIVPMTLTGVLNYDTVGLPGSGIPPTQNAFPRPSTGCIFNQYSPTNTNAPWNLSLAPSASIRVK